MYQDDPFYTLGLAERFGLLTLSAVLTVAVVICAALFMRGQRGSVRLAIAALAFTLFVWSSPQVYYGYYRLILDGLPQQWVVGPPPDLSTLTGLITFTGPPTIAAHSLGALFWGLVWLAWRLRPRGAVAPDPDH